MAHHSRNHGGKVARRDSCSHPNRSNGQQVVVCPNCRYRGISRRGCCEQAIDYHWKVMPLRVKEFILNREHLVTNGSISIEILLNFWSAPQNVDITRRVDICGTSWYLVRIMSIKKLIEFIVVTFLFQGVRIGY